MSSAPDFAWRLQRDVMRFSFGWMVAANCVGVLTALLLLFPSLSGWMGALSYGRWMPLHMEWQLYGWCSLPIVGLLLREFIHDGAEGGADARFALLAWSLGLLGGGMTFLGGNASGKLFLSWHGWSRAFFPLSLCLVWSVLATHWMRRWHEARFSRVRWGMQAVILMVLATVPFALFATSARTVYPPVNPHSGGATGHSLLASTLGLLGLIGAVPLLLRRQRMHSVRVPAFWIAYFGGWIAYLLLQHGSVANTERDQILGLGLLIPLAAMLVLYMRSWNWAPGSRPWLIALLVWWSLLTLDGWVTFLPGFLDRLKFTNAMVAHAHLAMAGMVTAFGFILLASLRADELRTGGHAFGGGMAFWLWNGACLVMVTVLLWQGWREGGNPGLLFGPDAVTTAIYGIRAASGMVMLGVSLWWLFHSMRKDDRLWI